MTFRGDEKWIRGRHAVENMACLRRIDLSLLKQRPGKKHGHDTSHARLKSCSFFQ